MRKHPAWLLLLLIPAVLVLGHFAGFSGGNSRVAAAPPLNLDKYLDEKLPEGPKEAVKVKADNTACHVCHGNYKEEPFALAHAKEDVGCIKCHGKSYDHRDDEDNITPPDKMYAPENIKKCCEDCHDEHDAPALKVIARWQERCLAKKDPKDVVCTDCHGQHRLKRRMVRWDKVTGEVIFIRSVPDPKKPAKDKNPDGEKK